MPAEDTETKAVPDDSGASRTTKTNDATDPNRVASKKEIGGQPGPDPTRYGDWEKAGRCIDF